MPSGDALRLEANEAVQQFAGSLTIPIMYPSANGPATPIGTGTLLTVVDRLFIVTAAHLFDNCDLDRFSIPSARANAKALRLRGSIHRPRNAEHIDVAVIELDDSVRAALNEWHSITLDNVSEASQDGRFVLCGYPTEYLDEEGTLQRYGVLTVFTERLLEIPPSAKKPVDPEIDLFFKYSDIGLEAGRDAVRMPHLRGTSGANVWQVVDLPDSELWAAAKVVKAVGIQASSISGEWFRAKSWEIVLDALSHIVKRD